MDSRGSAAAAAGTSVPTAPSGAAMARPASTRSATWQAALAWPLAIAGALVAVLLVLSPLYGFHRDELYFIVAGRHPALGYPDQPSLTPLLSAGAVALLGLSPTAIRILPALAVGGLVVIAALMARDLGGSRRAQALAALTLALSGLMAAGHLDSTATFDLFAWGLILWLVVRLLNGADPRWWIAVGVITGIDLENKDIVLFLGAGLAGGLLLARRWDVVRSPWAWGALAVAILLWLPNLAWQAANGFPQLEMARAIAGRTGDERAKLPVELVLLSGPLLFPVTIAGAWLLLRSVATRPWRTVIYAALVALALTFWVGGKSYYVVGFLPVLMAAGGIVTDRWIARGHAGLKGTSFGVAAMVSGAGMALLVLPLLPPATLATTSIPSIYKENAEQVGWPELAGAVDRAVAALPAADQSRAMVLTTNYGEAGAVELLGNGAVPVYSGHTGYWWWGPPPADRDVVVVVGDAGVGWAFDSCEMVDLVDNGVGLQNEEQGVGISVCRGLRRPWAELWPDLRNVH